MTHINLIPGEQGIRLSTLSPKYLHTNSTSHTWPFSAVAELIDNAYDPDVDASQLWIDIKRYGSRSDHCLTFTDNGNGMDSLKLHKMLSFGFCEKVAKDDHLPVGHYGNGFKSGSMRLGKNAIIFTKQEDSKSVGFLSQTYLEEIKAQTILVPIVSWDSNGDIFYIVKRADGDKALQDILKYSLFKTKEELQEQFDNIPSQSGTRIIISGMRKNQDGKSEFDFRTDIYDIRIPDDVESESNKYRRQERQNHIPESDYSLRAYCSILYLRPRMQIILRGKKVRTQVIAKSLSKTEVDTYKPNGVTKPIKVTFGFSQNKNHYGIMMYHRNRLIKPYVRVGYQLRANNLGVGVIGVIKCDYLQPTHNKQDFDYTKAYRSSMSALGSKLNDYWNEKKGKAQANSMAVIPEPKEVESLPDQLWVQCDNPECLKWRKLPAFVKSDDLPEKWYCADHPERKWRSCDVPEELEEENEFAVQPYVKKQKKRLERELEEKKKREKEAKKVKELELEVHKLEIQKKNAEIQKLLKVVHTKSMDQKEAQQREKLNAEPQSPQKLQQKPSGQKLTLTPLGSQSSLASSSNPVTVITGNNQVKHIINTTTITTSTQNVQQPAVCIVKVMKRDASSTINNKPITATSSTLNQRKQVQAEPTTGFKLAGSYVPKVGGPPIILKVNSQAAVKHVAHLPTMVPVSAVVVDPSPKVISVQSLAVTGQNKFVASPAQSVQPVKVKPPDRESSSNYRPLESLIEVNKHAAESSISPVSAVVPDNSTSSITSPTLGRKDVTINDRYLYIAPSGKTPISCQSFPQSVVQQQVKLESTALPTAPQVAVKTEPPQSTTSGVTKLKRNHNGVVEADEPPSKQKADAAVIVIDPPSPSKEDDINVDIKPNVSNTVLQTEVKASTETIIQNMDVSTSQEHTQNHSSIGNISIPNIDRSIVRAVENMSPQQLYRALLSRTQQLYELRGNVCKLLRILVPELGVDDQRENFEDQTVDELLQQVLEQAEASEPERDS